MLPQPSPISRERAVQLCRDPEAYKLLSAEGYTNCVVYISQYNVAIKFGSVDYTHEALNQRAAGELVDHSIVKALYVFDHFTSDEFGYLVMEFIPGAVSEHLSTLQYHKLGEAVQHLHSIQRATVIGPLSGGPAEGVIFEETRGASFTSKDEIQEWFSLWYVPDILQDYILSHLGG